MVVADLIITREWREAAATERLLHEAVSDETPPGLTAWVHRGGCRPYQDVPNWIYGVSIFYINDIKQHNIVVRKKDRPMYDIAIAKYGGHSGLVNKGTLDASCRNVQSDASRLC